MEGERDEGEGERIVSVVGLDTGLSSPNCSKLRNLVNAILVTILLEWALVLKAPKVR